MVSGDQRECSSQGFALDVEGNRGSIRSRGALLVQEVRVDSSQGVKWSQAKESQVRSPRFRLGNYSEVVATYILKGYLSRVNGPG